MTDYSIYSAGIERPMSYSKETGEEFIVVRLAVGQRSKLESIRLTEADALLLAAQLVDAVRNHRK